MIHEFLTFCVVLFFPTDEYSNYQEKQKIVERGPDDFNNPMSAFLGPRLWENTLLDNNDLKFEYMDIEEFLTEHGLPPGNDHQDMVHSQQQPTAQKADMVAQTPSPHSQAQLTPLTPPQHTPLTPPQQPPTTTHTPLMPVRRDDPCRKQEEHSTCRMQTSSCLQNNLRDIEELESKPVISPVVPPVVPPVVTPVVPSQPQSSHSSPSSPTKGKNINLSSIYF